MVGSPMLFAVEVPEQLQPVLEKLQPFLDRIEPYQPQLGIPAYIMMGIGVLMLLVALWRLLTLRIFRAFFTLIAAILVGYAPLAYGFHYYWTNYQEPQIRKPADVFEKMSQEEQQQEADKRKPQDWETYVRDHMPQVDYGIMIAGGILGVLLYWMTMGGKKKDYAADDSYTQPLPQQTGRPGGGQSNKNPFDFN